MNNAWWKHEKISTEQKHTITQVCPDFVHIVVSACGQLSLLFADVLNFCLRTFLNFPFIAWCSELLFFYLRTFLSFPFYLRMFLTFISTCRCFKLSVYCRCSKLLFLPANVLKLSVYCRCYNFHFYLRTFLSFPFIADVLTFISACGRS